MLGTINQSAIVLATTLLLCLSGINSGYGQTARQSKVYEFSTKSVETKIAVAGAVKSPGSYSIDAKTNTLSALITRVGGFTAQATGHVYLVRQGRTSTLILDGAKSNQEMANGDVIVACRRQEPSAGGTNSSISMRQSPVELNVILIGAYSDPVVLPIAPHENKLGILWGQILKQKPESLSKVSLIHMSQPRVPVTGLNFSTAESGLMDGSIVLIPGGLFNVASVPQDLKDWLQNPDIFTKLNKQAELEETMQPAIPVSESQILGSPIELEVAPTLQNSALPKSELEQVPIAFPLEMSLPEIPGSESPEGKVPASKLPQGEPAVPQEEKIPEIIPENEVATMLIPYSRLDQSMNLKNDVSRTYNSGSVAIRNELNRSVPELSITEEKKCSVGTAVSDNQIRPTGVTDDLGSTRSQNVPWVIDGNLKSVESMDDSPPTLAPRRLTQTQNVEVDTMANGNVPLPIELETNASNKGASIPYMMLISSMAALFAVAMLVMSYYLSSQADQEESIVSLGSKVEEMQMTQVQPESKKMRRRLQELIENTLPIVEEKIHFPAEITIYNLPQNKSKLRVDQDHMPQIQEVNIEQKTAINNIDDQILEMLNSAESIPTGKSGSIYRTDKSTGSVPAPVSGSRVERALQRTQREESHS